MAMGKKPTSSLNNDEISEDVDAEAILDDGDCSTRSLPGLPTSQESSQATTSDSYSAESPYVRNDQPVSLESSMMTSDMQSIKAHCEYSHRILQRQVQELKNAVELELRKSENEREANLLRANVTKLEQRLTALQRMVASERSGSDSGKHFIGDHCNDRTFSDLNFELGAISGHIAEMKRKQAVLERKIEATNGSRGQNQIAPESLSQIIDAFERQLGMYDVRIADMDQRFQVLETTSYNGSFVWKIRDFSRRKREAVSGRTLSLYSQPFYTSRYGYKICARVYLNGDGMGKETHMSLFFVIMKGEYDALLPWPFRQKVTLMLLDQGMNRRHLSDIFRPDPTSSSFKKPTSDMNIASGCPLFVAHNVIDGSSYVKEDTIFLRIHVDTTDLENF